MRRIVRLREEADRDLAGAAAWYEQQRTGLGQQFLDEVLIVLDAIAEQPLRYPIVHRSTRRAVLNRFPFSVYFLAQQSHIVVLGVLHASRNPRRWKDRI